MINEHENTIKEMWKNACKEDNIDPRSMFVVFSDDNLWAKKHNRAIQARNNFIMKRSR